MKAYIVPVENICNARCFFCITMFKKEGSFGTFLNQDALTKIGSLRNIESLEITGGGEPLLYPLADEIVKASCQMLPTTLYTNGKLLFRLSDETISRLSLLTVSRHHFDPVMNEKVMGMSCDSEIISETIRRGAKIRLTAVLCRRGMNRAEEVWEYLNWAKSVGVKQVQIRQFFEYEYGPSMKDELVRTEPVLKDLVSKYQKLRYKAEKYPTVYLGNLRVEFEGDKCACSIGVPNLRGDGGLYFGWTKVPLPIKFYRDEPATD